jgi:hypothetical protein
MRIPKSTTTCSSIMENRAFAPSVDNPIHKLPMKTTISTTRRAGERAKRRRIHSNLHSKNKDDDCGFPASSARSLALE